MGQKRDHHDGANQLIGRALPSSHRTLHPPRAAIELLVTKPGQYGLSVDGAPLGLKEAKPLPASD